MHFGVCCDLGVAALAAREGYDFAEGNVAAWLKPREPEEAFLASLADVRAAALPYPVVNCFIPGDLKITGEATDRTALQTYVETTMERAELAGVRVVVFGSGGARRIPEGFDPRRARDQLVAFCHMVAPRAHDHGVTVVVEPLNTAECNVLTTVEECARLVHDVSHPGLRLLVDAYHFMHDNDSYDDLVKHGSLLAHVHIATVPNRLAPAAEACDFSRFFGALADAGYNGRISIEGKIAQPADELGPALAAMRRSAGDCM